ncbi:MAG: acyl-CoA thioesterase [Candidatus Villigracilaceae bacterium]
MSAYRFLHPVEVRYGDLDPQGHVNNAKYLTYFEQARIAYLIHLGLFTKNQSFMEIGIILAEVRLTFKAPTHFGQNVQVGVRTTRLGNKSLEVESALLDCDDNRELAVGTAVLVTYDYAAGQSIPIPDSWRKAITQFESGE